MILVAIDFDDVISDQPSRWLQIMYLMEQLNFHVIVVTYRSPTCYPEDLDFLREKGYKVIMTGQKAKRPFVKALGYEPKIWIDDTPESILFDYNVFQASFFQNEKHDFSLK
jgi:hypothetical protein